MWLFGVSMYKKVASRPVRRRMSLLNCSEVPKPTLRCAARHPVSALPFVSTRGRRLLEQPGHAPVGQRFSPGLTGRAVLQRLRRERHFAHDVSAHRTRLTGAAVDLQVLLLL